MGRLWQAASTVGAILNTALLDKAVACGLRSLFIGFETLDDVALREQHKHHNISRQYEAVVRSLRERGVMINASFVFGMDSHASDVFDATVDWALSQGIETATFHVLTPYPGTRLHERLSRQSRITSRNWNLYDTRHCVFRPTRMSAEQLETGYWRAKRRFNSWAGIAQAAMAKSDVADVLRHLAYVGGWRKSEPLWAFIIRSGLLSHMRGPLESVLGGFGRYSAGQPGRRGTGVVSKPRGQGRASSRPA